MMASTAPGSSGVIQAHRAAQVQDEAHRLAGAARLFGESGDDRLFGGPHVGDWMDGGAGTDTCEDPDGWIVRDECEA